ncbi:hypothetical protein CKJ70_15295 [Mycobacterium avium]|nr:hypothetical protein CKJ70_15295 [Mycobacterium avium]
MIGPTDFQIILGKVRPLSRPHPEAHPQVLIIAPHPTGHRGAPEPPTGSPNPAAMSSKRLRCCAAKYADTFLTNAISRSFSAIPVRNRVPTRHARSRSATIRWNPVRIGGSAVPEPFGRHPFT